ncbi:LGFP repeat-containing protein, partial [Blastococcus sp. SYSU DS0973]
DAWLAAGGDGGDLGMPTADAASTPDGLAQFAHFQGGSLYLHRELGTRVVPRDVVLGWQEAGGPAGPLGYPIAEAVSTSDGVGVVMSFQGGEVYAASGAGGHALHGPVRDRYSAAGGPDGELGYPTTGVRTLPGGGAFAHFEGGSVYWTQATGARIVSGPVRDRWAAAGWETGVLGFPTTDVLPLSGGGRFAHFEGGSVYWTQATGARIVSGPVRD